MGYLGLLLLNNLEVIPSVFKLFTRSEIFVSYFIYNLNHFKLKKYQEQNSCDIKGFADDLSLIATLESPSSSGKEGFDADTLKEIAKKTASIPL